MPKVDTLIRTKLHLPFTRMELVPRPRLQARIAEGLRGPLTLVTAPAGFGKTTLVASCITDCGMPVAWLSLDKNDNQPGRFLSYLVAALQAADLAVGSDAAQLLASSQPAPAEAVLTSLINDLDTRAGEIALVLDDYQYMNSQAVFEAVAFLLDHSPRTFHLVIATRSDPPLPLSRLRARGQTVELRAADLRFTADEAAQFLNDVMVLHLDAGSVALLEAHTEGWITGLQMAALSMRDRTEVRGFIEGFSGTNRYILDYLLEEVLAREPEEVQAFLLQTAILNRLTGPLCDAVTGASGGQAMLESLERRNLFVVPLDDDRRWYRYHHLFADLLQARFYQSGPDRVPQLLSRAAGWCEQDGQVAEAVSYALAAQDYARAAALVEKHWQSMTNNGEIETAWSWLNALPESVVRRSAPLSAAYCMVLWLTGQVGAIEAHLVDAERTLEELEGSRKSAKDPTAETAAQDASFTTLSVVLAAMRSFVARHHEAYDAASAFGERALSLIPADLPPQVILQLRTLAFLAQASAYDGAGDLEKAASAYAETIRGSRLSANAAGVTGITCRLVGALRLLGRLRAADTACRDALGYIQAQGMARLPAAGILHVAISEVLVEQNDLEAAEAHIARAVALGKWSGRMDAVKNTGNVLSRLRLARQDAAGALAAIQEADAALVEPASPLARAELLALRARVLVRQGAVTEAVQCVEQAVRRVGQERGQTRAIVDMAASRVLLAQCKPGEAVAALTRSLAAAEESGRLGAAIELLILRSLALVRQGAAREAESDLERALTLAGPEGYVRIFIDEGQPMQMLISHWLSHAAAGPLRDYAVRLLSQFDGELYPVAAAQENTPPSGDLVEPLSPRELEVLRLMALGRTNPEIARQLIVAPGTIKAHAASIYRKLDAANRTEAVARARQLGILT